MNAESHPVRFDEFELEEGNALLTRWPVLEDRKIILPERNRFRDMQRAAVAATVSIAGQPVRVYCVHLDTMTGIEGAQRLHQVNTLLADAAPYTRVIVLGDLNNRNQVGRLFTKAGFEWLTRDIGHTLLIWTWRTSPDSSRMFCAAATGGAICTSRPAPRSTRSIIPAAR